MGIGIRKERLTSLEIIRVFACLEIFACHCLWKGGACGVSLFIILSGFLLTYNHLDSYVYKERNIFVESIKFGVKKMKALYPLHIAIMLIIIGMQVYQWCNGGNLNWALLGTQTLAQIFLVHTWVPVENIYFSLNGVAWYLSTSFFTYLCFPFILKFLRKLKTNKGAVIYAVVIFLIQVFVAFLTKYIFPISNQDHYYLTYVCPYFRIGDFIIGCLLGKLFLNRKEVTVRIQKGTVLELIAILGVLISHLLYLKPSRFHWLTYSMVFTPTSCLLIYLFACARGAISKASCNKFVFWFAKLTPFIFLLHQQLIGHIKPLFADLGGMKQKICVAIVAMALSILCSLAYQWIMGRLQHKKTTKLTTGS